MTKKSYTALPALPAESKERYETVLAVLWGELTVKEGARRLGLSRNHFQTVMHRVMAAMIEELGPRQGGRPPMPEAERRLKRDTEKLRLEKARLQRQVETSKHMLSVATGLLKGRLPRMRHDAGEDEPGPSEDE